MQAQTKVKLGATAGLRLLKEGKADAILAAVAKYLHASPFSLDAKTGVTVLDGARPAWPRVQAGAQLGRVHVRALPRQTGCIRPTPAPAWRFCSMCGQLHGWSLAGARHLGSPGPQRA